MKTAVVLTGHLRCWRQVFPNFKEKIIDRYNPDIFIHTWNEEGWWIPGDKNNAKGYHEETPSVEYDEIANTYNPKKIVIEDWDDYNQLFTERGDTYANFFHRPKNILSMFFKLYSGISMLEEYSALNGITYDLVIRMRPDMLINQDIPEFDTTKFYTLMHRNHLGTGTGDMMQVGSMFAISLFSKLPCYINYLYSKTNVLCPHVMSEQWIHEMNLQWEEISIDKTLQHTPKGPYIEV